MFLLERRIPTFNRLFAFETLDCDSDKWLSFEDLSVEHILLNHATKEVLQLKFGCDPSTWPEPLDKFDTLVRECVDACPLISWFYHSYWKQRPKFKRLYPEDVMNILFNHGEPGRELIRGIVAESKRNRKGEDEEEAEEAEEAENEEEAKEAEKVEEGDKGAGKAEEEKRECQPARERPKERLASYMMLTFGRMSSSANVKTVEHTQMICEFVFEELGAELTFPDWLLHLQVFRHRIASTNNVMDYVIDYLVLQKGFKAPFSMLDSIHAFRSIAHHLDFYGYAVEHRTITVRHALANEHDAHGMVILWKSCLKNNRKLIFDTSALLPSMFKFIHILRPVIEWLIYAAGYAEGITATHGEQTPIIVRNHIVRQAAQAGDAELFDMVAPIHREDIHALHGSRLLTRCIGWEVDCWYSALKHQGHNFDFMRHLARNYLPASFACKSWSVAGMASPEVCLDIYAEHAMKREWAWEIYKAFVERGAYEGREKKESRKIFMDGADWVVDVVDKLYLKHRLVPHAFAVLHSGHFGLVQWMFENGHMPESVRISAFVSAKNAEITRYTIWRFQLSSSLYNYPMMFRWEVAEGELDMSVITDVSEDTNILFQDFTNIVFRLAAFLKSCRNVENMESLKSLQHVLNHPRGRRVINRFFISQMAEGLADPNVTTALPGRQRNMLIAYIITLLRSSAFCEQVFQAPPASVERVEWPVILHTDGFFSNDLYTTLLPRKLSHLKALLGVYKELTTPDQMDLWLQKHITFYKDQGTNRKALDYLISCKQELQRRTDEDREG